MHPRANEGLDERLDHEALGADHLDVRRAADGARKLLVPVSSRKTVEVGAKRVWRRAKVGACVAVLGRLLLDALARCFCDGRETWLRRSGLTAEWAAFVPACRASESGSSLLCICGRLRRRLSTKRPERLVPRTALLRAGVGAFLSGGLRGRWRRRWRDHARAEKSLTGDGGEEVGGASAARAAVLRAVVAQARSLGRRGHLRRVAGERGEELGRPLAARARVLRVLTRLTRAVSVVRGAAASQHCRQLVRSEVGFLVLQVAKVVPRVDRVERRDGATRSGGVVVRCVPVRQRRIVVRAEGELRERHRSLDRLAESELVCSSLHAQADGAAVHRRSFVLGRILLRAHQMASVHARSLVVHVCVGGRRRVVRREPQPRRAAVRRPLARAEAVVVA
mmetsp:Transcript_52221/g.113784  ORF Transcript_52221/g.113784 Transcript_52221/m.113784 type:complete len:394 (-) Transcript_52221:592-1773(-)